MKSDLDGEFWISRDELRYLKQHRDSASSSLRGFGGLGVHFWNDVTPWSIKNKGMVRVRVTIKEAGE